MKAPNQNNQLTTLVWQNGLSHFLQSLPQALRFKKKAEKTRNSVRKILSSLSKSLCLPTFHVLADRAAAVKHFPRVIVGLIFIAILAPYSDIFYTRLDFNARVSADVWYYESYHWLFLCLGPYLKSIFFTIGLYLVFARGSSILSLIAAYALMYDIGKVFWLLQVTTHEEYKSLPTGWFLAYGFLTGCFTVFLADMLTYWLNHRVMAIKARLQGLRNIADKADPQMIVSGFVKTMDDDVMVQQFKQY